MKLLILKKNLPEFLFEDELGLVRIKENVLEMQDVDDMWNEWIQKNNIEL